MKRASWVRRLARPASAPKQTLTGHSQLFARPDIQNFKTVDSAPGHYIGVVRDGKFAYSSTIACKDQYLSSILEAGCYIGYDNFGNLGYPHMYLGKVVNLTTDLARIRDIKELIERGYLDQILLGQDLVFKDMVTAYGGYGYAHLLETAVPLMRDMGVAEEHIRAMLVDNPCRFLTFGEPVG